MPLLRDVLPATYSKWCVQQGSKSEFCLFLLQGSVAVFYNWLKIEHTWVTDLIQDYAVPVSYVGLSTKDRRLIYPQKEVRRTLHRQLHLWY